MSDQGRKDISQKVGEAVKPDSQKSYYEKTKGFVGDKADKVAGAVQPEEKKGVVQGASDAAQSGKDAAQSESSGDKAKEYLESSKEKFNEAVEYVSSKIHGGSGKGTEAGDKDDVTK